MESITPLINDLDDNYDKDFIFINAPANETFVIFKKEKDKLIPVKFKTISSGENHIKCPLTHYKFKDDDDVLQLPCSHYFKADAIINWLTKEKGECPVCIEAVKEN